MASVNTNTIGNHTVRISNTINTIVMRVNNIVEQLIDPPRKLTTNEQENLKKYLTNQLKLNKKQVTDAFIQNIAIVYYDYITHQQHQTQQLITHNKTNIVNLKEMMKTIIAEIDNEDAIQLNNTNTHNINTSNSSLHMQKQQDQSINIDKIAYAITSLKQLARWFNPSALYKKAYVCLDSKYARFNDDNTKMTWDLSHTLSDTQNSTNVLSAMRNIVSLRLYSIFIKNFATDQRRSTILIDELSAQSFILPNGRRFHVVSFINDLSGSVELSKRTNNIYATDVSTPDPILHDKIELLSGYRFNEGYYRFSNPISNIFNTLSISIGNPFNLVTLQRYQYDNCVIESLNYTTPIKGSIIIRLSHNHTFATDDNIYSVFLSNFTTSNTVADKYLISDMNTAEFTAARLIAPNKIEIYPSWIRPPNHDGIYIYTIIREVPFSTAVGTMSNVTVQLTGYRMIINMELTYMDYH